MSKYELLHPDVFSSILLGSVKVERAGLEKQRKKAEMLDFFYEQDNHVFQSILVRDLLKYVSGADISRIRMITVDSYVPSFLSKICNVNDNPPSILLSDGKGESFKKEMESLSDLLSEVRLTQGMSETHEKMRLHNTILNYIRYNKKYDRISLDNNYNVGSSFVVTDQEDSLEPIAVSYEILGADQKPRWVVWDRDMKEHYILKTSSELPEYDYNIGFQGTKTPVGENKDLVMPKYSEDYDLPFVTYRYKNHNNMFWGNGMDFLTDLVRSINLLLTICQDDTIQESIRLLILNFNPTGTEDDAHGNLKTGFRHPLYTEGGGIGSENKPEGQILSADLYTDDVLKLIDSLSDIASHLYNIDSPLRARLKENLAGIAIRMRNEPLLRNWSHDINIVKYPDLELIKKIILVNNYHRPEKKINEKLIEYLTIEYAEPTIVTDEKADYELEQLKWADGTSSPVKWLMSKDPNMTEDDAKKAISDNIAEATANAPKETEPPKFSFKKKEEKVEVKK